MNKGAFSEEFENGSRKIKEEKLEDMDFDVETLYHSIDIKEEAQLEDCKPQICKFKPELEVDTARTTGPDRLLESDNLRIPGGNESPPILFFGLEQQNSLDGLSSTSTFSAEEIQDTPATSTNYFTRNCNRNNRNIGGLRTGKESSNVSASREKLQLQIEYLKLQNCLSKLQTLKLQRQLKLSKS